MLAAAVLPAIALVMQLDVCADDLLVISLDLAELVRDVNSEMIWDLYIATVHHDVHMPSTACMTASYRRRAQAIHRR